MQKFLLFVLRFCGSAVFGLDNGICSKILTCKISKFKKYLP
jgi:hypothetical protein